VSVAGEMFERDPAPVAGSGPVPRGPRPDPWTAMGRLLYAGLIGLGSTATGFWYVADPWAEDDPARTRPGGSGWDGPGLG
jgi:hypothetical protein